MKVVSACSENLDRAAEILRGGGIVILPTETVYGIACDATSTDAVRKVFAAKGRPAANPMIVHVWTEAQARSLARRWPKAAESLAKAFWPGPLTLVVRRSARVSPDAAAGLETVAIRMPDHPVTLGIIERAGVPLAAPSANRYMRLSPTRVEHLDPELITKVDLVVDGGPCHVGIESSVVDVTTSPPRLLRPGGISRDQIERALQRSLAGAPSKGLRRSPGMHRRHYAPESELRIVDKLDEMQTGLVFGDPQTARQIKMPMHSAAYGASLFDALHHLDGVHPGTIFVEAPPKDLEWEAVWDRLKRAAEEG